LLAGALNRQMPKTIDALTLSSSAATMARKAETYPPETQVIDLAKLRQIIRELGESSEQGALPS
jgi:hypothetical protein